MFSIKAALSNKARVTLPNVETFNIVKSPPKGVFTRKKDKIEDTNLLNEIIGDSMGSRVEEAINVYPRGINPMVNVNYQNAHGGVVTATQGSQIPASSPYKIMADGVFRPALETAWDRLPIRNMNKVEGGITAPSMNYYMTTDNNNRPKPTAVYKVINNLPRKVDGTINANINRPIYSAENLQNVIDTSQYIAPKLHASTYTNPTGIAQYFSGIESTPNIHKDVMQYNMGTNPIGSVMSNYQGEQQLGSVNFVPGINNYELRAQHTIPNPIYHHQQSSPIRLRNTPNTSNYANYSISGFNQPTHSLGGINLTKQPRNISVMASMSNVRNEALG